MPFIRSYLFLLNYILHLHCIYSKDSTEIFNNELRRKEGMIIVYFLGYVQCCTLYMSVHLSEGFPVYTYIYTQRNERTLNYTLR